MPIFSILDRKIERKEKGVIMGEWLKCTISPGQFSGEYAVQGKMFDDSGFSLFAPKADLRFKEEPTKEKSVEGLVRVVSGATKEDLLLVSLPRPTFENGRTITINENQLKKAD